jgi:hypothetical protein
MPDEATSEESGEVILHIAQETLVEIWTHLLEADDTFHEYLYLPNKSGASGGGGGGVPPPRPRPSRPANDVLTLEERKANLDALELDESARTQLLRLNANMDSLDAGLDWKQIEFFKTVLSEIAISGKNTGNFANICRHQFRLV